MEECVSAHRACLAKPVLQPAGDEVSPLAEAGPPDPAGKFAETARRKHELVHAPQAEGRGLREIARPLGWGQDDQAPDVRSDAAALLRKRVLLTARR